MRLFVSSFFLTMAMIAAAFTGTARSVAGADTTRSDKTDSTSDSDPDPICDTCWVTTGYWPDTAGTFSITDLTSGINTKTDTSGTSVYPHRPPPMRWQYNTTQKVFTINPLSTMISTNDRFSKRPISMRDFLEIREPITLNTETASITAYIETGSDIEAATVDTSGT